MNWSAANRRMGYYSVRDGVDRAVLYLVIWHFFGWSALLIAFGVLSLAAAVYEVWQKRKAAS